MTIKHIVIPAGGAKGFFFYGALQHLNRCGFWNYKNIQNIYGTSIGSFIAVLIALQIDWDILDAYLINRPWNKLVKIDSSTILSAFINKGAISNNIMKEILKPLLLSKDIDLDVTLKQFYEITKINIHMFTININKLPLKTTELSCNSHPNLKLITAIQMTTAVPFVIEPVIYKRGCYVDGALLNYQPVLDCIKQTKCNLDEMLVIQDTKKGWDNTDCVTKDTNLFEFSTIFTQGIIHLINKKNKINKNIPNLKNCVNIICNKSHTEYWIDAFSNKEARESYIKSGVEYGELFEIYRKTI